MKLLLTKWFWFVVLAALMIIGGVVLAAMGKLTGNEALGGGGALGVLLSYIAGRQDGKKVNQ